MTVAPPEIEFASMIANEEDSEIPCDVGAEFCQSKHETGAEWWFKVREHEPCGDYIIDALVCTPCKAWFLNPETVIACGCGWPVKIQAQIVDHGKI